MPSPVVAAAYRHVMASGIPALLIQAGLLGRDADGEAYASGWVFAGGQEGLPYREIEGTSRCAVVLYHYDEWAAPANFRSAQYPRLNLAVYADPTRDESGSPIKHDAEDKMLRVWRALHPLFHDPGNRIHAFDSLRVHSTVQSGSQTSMEVPDGDGAVRGLCPYALAID